MTLTLTATFAEWLTTTRWQDLPPAVQQKAVDVVFDSVGAMIGCSRLPEVEALVRLQRRMGGEAQCTMIGHAGLTSVINAAMVNGGMAHGNESDPLHLKSAGGHVAAGPVPTALTVGQWLGPSGIEVLREEALGYEFGGRVMTVFYKERDYVARRFYPAAVVGALSPAVAAGVLLDLNATQMRTSPKSKCKSPRAASSARLPRAMPRSPRSRCAPLPPRMANSIFTSCTTPRARCLD